MEVKKKMDTNDLRSLQEAYLEVVNGQQLDEAVKGEDSEMRRAAAAERRSGDKRVSPSKVKDYVKQQKRDISYMDKLTKKNKDIVGMTHEEVELDEDSRRMSNKQHTARVRDNIKRFKNSKIEYTPPSNYDPDANRGKGEVLTRKQIEKKRRKALRQESGDFDTFDIVLDYIFEEELVDTLEEALVLMSEELDQDDIDFILDEAFKQFPEKKVSRKIQREKDRLRAGMDRAEKISGTQLQGRQDELNRKRAGRITKMSRTMSDKTFTSPEERTKMNTRAQKTTRTMDRIKDNQTGSDTYKGRPRAYGLDPMLKSKKKEEPKKSESTKTTSKRKSLAVKAARAVGKVAGKVARKLSK